MYRCALWTGVVVAGLVLAWSLGCQTETQHASPGALPSTLRQDSGPRLNASTYFAHAHLLERQGNLEAAVAQYRQALELSPEFVSGRNRLGITLNKLGRNADASTEFRRAIEQAPAQAYLYNNLGFSLYLEGRYPEAAESLQRAIELRPEFKRARMNHGAVLAKLERYDDALTEFCLGTGEADAHYNMGVIYSDVGRLADAARSLEAALRLNPSFEAAREQLRIVAHMAAQEPAVPRVPERSGGSVEAGQPAGETLAAAKEVSRVARQIRPIVVEETERPTWLPGSQEAQAMPDVAAADGESTAPFDWAAFEKDLDAGAFAPILDQLALAAAYDWGAMCDLIMSELDGYLSMLASFAATSAN